MTDATLPKIQPKRFYSSWWFRAVIAVGVLSLISDLADTPDLLSQGVAGASLRFAVPIGLAGLGGLWAERSGVLNIGLEGMMIIGTFMGAWAGFQWGPWAGVASAILGGAVLGIFLAILTVTFGVDQAIAGIVINVAALGLGRFLASLFFVGQPGGGISQSPSIDSIQTVSLPGIDTLLRPLVEANVVMVSDVASLLLGVTTEISLLTILAIACVPGTWWILFRSSFGLRLRSAGENPAAADSLGVDPNKLRFVALTVSGALAGLGGAFLVTVSSSIYREGQVAGRGFIGLATVIFGNWMPGRLSLGALLFGFTDAMRTRQEKTITALLLVAALVFLVFAILAMRKRRTAAMIGYGVASIGFALWFFVIGTVPSEFVSFAPQVTTLLVLSLGYQKLRSPTAVGVPYRRTEET